MISDSHKLLFIHIPKCGGSSIEQMFNMQREVANKIYSYTVRGTTHKFLVNRQHATAEEAAMWYGHARWIDYTTFTFVRNPYSRFVSWYRHMHRLSLIPAMSFEEFTLKFTANSLPECKDIHFNMGLPQMTWIQSLDDIDFIGRLEQIEVDITRLCRDIAHIRTPKVSKVGAAPRHEKYKEFYNCHTGKLVAEYYSEDFNCLGYSKEL